MAEIEVRWVENGNTATDRFLATRATWQFFAGGRLVVRLTDGRLVNGTHEDGPVDQAGYAHAQRILRRPGGAK